MKKAGGGGKGPYVRTRYMEPPKVRRTTIQNQNHLIQNQQQSNTAAKKRAKGEGKNRSQQQSYAHHAAAKIRRQFTPSSGVTNGRRRR